MTTRYVIFEPGGESSKGAVFLRDRFHIVAFLLPFLWLGAHRLYLAAVAAFLVQGALFRLAAVDGFGFVAIALLVLFGTAVALEGPRLVAARLRRRGFREAGVIHASGLDEAELLYYGEAAGPVAAEQAPPAAPVSSPQAPIRARTDLPQLGWRSGRSLLDAGTR